MKKALLVLSLVSTEAMAASQIGNKINNLGQEIISDLSVASVVFATIAAITAGYKVMSGDAHGKQQAVALGVGAILCFAAPTIVQVLLSALA